MLGLLLGVGIGYLTFNDKGREIGKKIIETGIEKGAKIINDVKEIGKKEKTD